MRVVSSMELIADTQNSIQEHDFAINYWKPEVVVLDHLHKSNDADLRKAEAGENVDKFIRALADVIGYSCTRPQVRVEAFRKMDNAVRNGYQAGLKWAANELEIEI